MRIVWVEKKIKAGDSVASGQFFLFSRLRVKHVNLSQIITQVGAFVRAENSKGKTHQRPKVHDRVSTAVMLAQFMDLGMTIMAARDAIVRSRGLDLFVLQLSIGKTLLLESGLQEAATAAAAVVIWSGSAACR
jgi:hypothetical protein